MVAGFPTKVGAARVPAAASVFALAISALAGCSSSSDPVPPIDDPPPALEFLDARPGAFADTLVWNRTEIPDFSSYRIARTWRGILGPVGADTVWIELGRTFASGDTSWVDEDVSPGHFYEYAVRVEDQAGQIGEPISLGVRLTEPTIVALGFEPRRSHPVPGRTLPISLWVAGARDLHGLVLQLVHGAPLLACETGTPFGDPTLAICTGSPEGPTDLALSGVRGGATIDGVAILAEFVLDPNPAVPESIVVLVRSLARENGEPIDGADEVVLRAGLWEPGP